jgi:membrane protease YdiL (CAAX protease family)
MPLILELIFLLTLGNLASLVAWLFNISIGTGIPTFAIALIIYACILIRYRPLLDLRKINFSLKNFAIAIGAALFFLFPIVVGNLDYTPIKELTLGWFLVRIFLEIPFTTALSEELLFRQYFYRKIEAKRVPKFLAIHGLLFMLWHLVVCLRTVLDTNLDNANVFLGIFSYIGALFSVFVGGVVFLLVRYWTGSPLFSTISHWLNVALMTTVIWLK